ncbi:hypothetical protein DYB38_000480 [Aphanomyces astaci]|uniref:MIR domain-containing protein n=1 Tax=Aphanomyces astaci TaxID=112090 RepID=A0A397E9Y8_APHAT|nr:hypothetical protein DYB38_000480 [Aphanomyces astaci]RHZ33022.1 hypothetical protein DYB31_000424 [Aphanomyces astaci]
MERAPRRHVANALYEGDTIYLKIDGEGNVHSDGFVDERLGCIEMTSQHDAAQELEGCLFKVLPKLSYEAHKALLRIKSQFAEGSDKYILMAQQAKVESDLNATVCRRTGDDGQVVLYGQTIQLQHVRSGKFLTSRVKTLADVDKTCMKVCVSRAKYTKHFLHLSQRSYPRDQLQRKEVNMNAKETIVKVIKYAAATPDVGRALQAGKLYRIFHLEGQGYVTMSANPNAATKPPYLRLVRPATTYNAPENLTLKSLFVLEKANPLEGGRVTNWDDKCRLRHLATGRYLSLGPQANDDDASQVALTSATPDQANGDGAYFRLTPSSSGAMANAAQLSCRDCFRFVAASETETQEACFLHSAVQHLRRYDHDLSTALSLNIRITHELMYEKLTALKLLVSFLLTRQDSGAADDDDTRKVPNDDPVFFEGAPVPARQEKAREIKLIDVLYQVLRGIRQHRVTMSTLASDPKYKVLHRIHRLSNKVLVCVVQDNIVNKNYIANRSADQYFLRQATENDDYRQDMMDNSSPFTIPVAPPHDTLTYMDETLDNIGSETGSKSVYRSLFLNNGELLEQKVDLALIKSSCRSIQAKGVKASGILQFLSTICSHHGQNISRNQELIVRALYSLNDDQDMQDTRHNILIESCECPTPVRAVPAIMSVPTMIHPLYEINQRLRKLVSVSSKDFVLAAPSGSSSFSHDGHPMGYSMLNKGMVNVAISWKSCANWFMGASGLYFEADELQLSTIVDALVSEDLIQYDKHLCKEPLPRQWVLLEHVTWTLQPKDMFPLVFNNKPWADQFQTISKDPEKVEMFERLQVLANYYKLQLGLFAELLRGGCISAIEVPSCPMISRVIHEIISRMAFEKSMLCSVDANVLLSSLLEIVSWLVRCGFYADLDSHSRLAGPLIRLLDGRNTVVLADSPAHDSTARYRCNKLHNAVTKCKLQICQILGHITLIWRDFELWSVVSNFKFSNSVVDPLVLESGELGKAGVNHFVNLFAKSALDMRVVTKAPLETICMDLIMYDDDHLVHEALALLLQLNTRREQVLNYLMKCILVWNTVPNVAIAASTKSSSQVLKELEYIVPLFKHYIQAFESPLLCEHLCDANHVRLGYFGVGRLLVDILVKLEECCADRLHYDDSLQPNVEKQAILLELLLHEHAMKLIRMHVVDTQYDPQLQAVKDECCAFFKALMAKNPAGQKAMFDYLPELIDRFVDQVDGMGDVLINMFVDNRSLCLCVPDQAIWAFMKLLNNHVGDLRHPDPAKHRRSSSSNAISTIMEFFKRYIIPDEAPVKANQVHLFAIMTNPQFDHLLLPFGQDITPDMDVGSSSLRATAGYTALMHVVETPSEADLLAYFEKLLEAFSVMCYGKNFKTEVECQQLYPLNLILTVLLDDAMPLSLRVVASKFLSEVFFDTDLEVDPQLAVMPAVWDVLLHCSKQLATFNALSYELHTSSSLMSSLGEVVYDTSFIQLQEHIFQGVLCVVTSFFRGVYDPSAADLNEQTIHIYDALKADLKSLKKRAKLGWRQLEVDLGGSADTGLTIVPPPTKPPLTTRRSRSPLQRVKSREVKIGALQRPAPRLGLTSPDALAAAQKFDEFKYAMVANADVAASVLDEFRDLVEAIEDIESLTSKTPGEDAAANPLDGRANTITPTLFCSRVVKFIQDNPASSTSATTGCVVYAIEALLQLISTKHLTEDAKKKLQTVEIEEARVTYQDTQSFMAGCGAAKLVLNLIAGGYKSTLVLKAVEFGIEMLYGGNVTVQTIFYNSMKDGDERLFLQIDQILQHAIEQVKETRRSFKYIKESRKNRGPAMVAAVDAASATLSAEDAASAHLDSTLSGDILVKFLASYVGHANSVNVLQTVTAYLAILVKDELQLQNMTSNDCTSLNQCWEFLVETMQGPCSPNQEFLMGSVMVEIFRKTIKAQINVRTDDDDTDELPTADLVKSLKANSVKAMVSLLEGRTNDQVQTRLRSTLEIKAIKNRLVVNNNNVIIDNVNIPKSEKEQHKADVTWDERFLQEGVALFTLATSVFASAAGDDSFAPVATDAATTKAPKRGDFSSESAYRRARDVWKRDATYAKVYAFFDAMHCSIELWWGVGEPRLDKVYFPKASHCRMLRYLKSKKNRLLSDLDYKSSERLKQFTSAASGFNEEMQHIENLSNFFLYNIVRPYIPHFKNISFLLAIFMNLIMLVSIRHQDESLEFYFYPSSLQEPMTYFGIAQICLSTLVLVFMLVISGPLIFRARLNAMIKNSMDKYKRKKNYTKQDVAADFDIKNAIQTIDIKQAMQLENMSSRAKGGAKWLKKTAIQLAQDSVHFVRSYLPFVKMIFLMYLLQFTLLQAFPDFPDWMPFLVLFLPFVRNTREYLEKSSSWVGLLYTFVYDVIFDKITAFYSVYLVTAFCATLIHPIFYGYHLLDLVIMSPSLQNVVRAVTKPGRALALTCLLGLFVIYFYTMLLFFFNPTDSTDDDTHIEYCSTLMDCFLTVVHRGLISGGGIGDYLTSGLNHPPNINVRMAYWLRILYDLSFFVLVIVLLLNIIFGITIDTFGDLRTETNEREDLKRNQCFVCGLSRDVFDNHYMQLGISNGFDKHITQDHNMWSYLYFIVHLQSLSLVECTGPEAYVKCLLEKDDVSWFPQSMAKCLAKTNEHSTEHDLVEIKGQLKALASQVV